MREWRCVDSDGSDSVVSKMRPRWVHVPSLPLRKGMSLSYFIERGDMLRLPAFVKQMSGRGGVLVRWRTGVE